MADIDVGLRAYPLAEKEEISVVFVEKTDNIRDFGHIRASNSLDLTDPRAPASDLSIGRNIAKQ